MHVFFDDASSEGSSEFMSSPSVAESFFIKDDVRVFIDHAFFKEDGASDAGF